MFMKGKGVEMSERAALGFNNHGFQHQRERGVMTGGFNSTPYIALICGLEKALASQFDLAFKYGEMGHSPWLVR